MGLPELHSERVVLRPWTHHDVDALHALFIAPDVRRYLWDDVAIPRETVVEVVQSHVAASERYGIGYWAVILLRNSPAQRSRTAQRSRVSVSLVGRPALRRLLSAPSQLAGFCGLRFIGDGPEIELMYGLYAEHWKKGLATEACRTALEYLWRSTRFERVYARTDPPNTSSVRVMQRLGMAEESSTPTMITYVLQRPI